MARAETLFAIGYRLDRLTVDVRAALMTQIYLFAKAHLPRTATKQIKEFREFFEEMLRGLDPESLEEGARPKTLDEIRAEIDKLALSDINKSVCFQLVKQMEPPEPLVL